ncbi:Kdo hydroxylase family protein [Tatumella terrea]|uniref:Kdo hydroxylase family protein n=1 Tax=Tatumella terrea TaxID=419007 RepID=UPI0031D9B9F4
MQPESLRSEELFFTVPLTGWSGGEPFSQSALTALEQGQIISLPGLEFPLNAKEMRCLNEGTVKKGRKNISYRALSGKITGVAHPQDEDLIRSLLQRHHQACETLVRSLLPHYTGALHTPVNTLRVHPVTAWKKGSSWRKDDTRLHVDAFPSRPMQGERILRIFTNINPHGESRVWRIGEPFTAVATRFLPKTGHYSPWLCALQHKLGITKRYRTRYDHLMLGLHDAMKSDAEYQLSGLQLEVRFPPGSSWICFSDQTPHAAMSGQFMLEQTYALPAEAMADPQRSPLKILEKLTGARLL